MTSDIPQRLAAILAADIAGYTRLMEQGEARVVASWRRARDEVIDPTVAHFNGRIVKLTGDGFLAEFATAESAVRAALEMQARFAEMFGAEPAERRVEFRMGVNLGDVWVDKDDIYGAGVNVAARLEALAEPGAICISGAVYEAVKHKVEARFNDLGPRQVKNVTEPVRVYRVGSSGPSTTSQAPSGTSLRRPLKYAASLVLAGVIAASGYGYWQQQLQSRVLFESTIPEIEMSLDAGDFEQAFARITEAQSRMPDARELDELMERAAWRVDLKSEPAGARVLRRAYGPGENGWVELGITPLEDIYLPFGLSQLRLEREGSVPLLRAIGGGGLIFSELPERDVPGGASFWYVIGSETFKLDAVGSIPEGKVRVPGVRDLVNGGSVEANDFFLDRYEVTNAQYKAFMNAGGYEDARLWETVVVDGEELPWEEVPKRFADRTGRPGPSTWEGGDYPRGADDLPVTGVSWYEASAYARFKGQELPTIHHWQRAAAVAMQAWELPLSRFAADSPLPVGQTGAVSWVGAFDLLGNAQEWTATRSGDGVLIAGGAWNDRQHLSAPWGLHPLDRSPGNGLRLAITSDEPAVREVLHAPLSPVPERPTQTAVSEEIYAALSRSFAYDPTDLRATIDATQETHAWTRQRISFDAAYPGPRMVLYLYLPRNSRPPYQTVIHWPGGAAWSMASIDDYSDYLDFGVKNGRAVAWPVYLGTFERGDSRGPPRGANTTAFRDQFVHSVNDLRRTIDYLETRQDIDSRAIAFYGLSLGAFYGATALAQDNRISLAVMEVLPVATAVPASPEVDPVNALPRITVPTLLMSGELDPFVLLDDARRSFALLGADPSDKRHVIGEGTHYMPRDQMIRETLEWLDKHFGPPPRDLSQTSPARPPSAA